MASREPASVRHEEKHRARWAASAAIMVVVGVLVFTSPVVSLSFPEIFIPLFIGLTLTIVYLSVYFAKRILVSSETSLGSEHQD